MNSRNMDPFAIAILVVAAVTITVILYVRAGGAW